jgi:carbamoyltransferase
LPPHSKGTYCWRDYVPQETMFWRRSLWKRAGNGLDDEFQFALDWELVLRFVRHQARFAHVPRFLGVFTTHPQQKSLAIRESQGEKEFARLRSEFAPTRWLQYKYKVLGASYLLYSIWWCLKGKCKLGRR